MGTSIFFFVMLAKTEKNRFLVSTPENGDFNQYWYSDKTIGTIIEELAAQGCTSVACIACPSIFFTLKQLQPAIFDKSILLDIDTQWEKEKGYVRYDFREPLTFPESLHHQYTCVIIDPPFVTRDAWVKFAEAGKFLGSENVLYICSTIAENADMMKELLGVVPVPFQPSIPHLIYQVCNSLSHTVFQFGPPFSFLIPLHSTTSTLTNLL
jgi:hypothetical protein